MITDFQADITASSVYDRKSCRKLVNNVFPARKPILIIDLIITVITIVFIILFALSDVQKFNRLALVLIFLLITDAGLGLIYLYAPLFQYKAMGELKDAVSEFTFGSEQFKVKYILTNGEIRNGPIANYDSIYKLVKKDNYIFIFHKRYQSYIIDINTIKNASADELIKIIESNSKNEQVR